jgi:DNA-binding transcriptional MerR regulator
MSQEGFTIDELARLAGSNVRNVRLYQERGLLPPVVRQGRSVRYGQAHLERLELVRDLISRGYPLAAIRELLDAWEGRGLEGLCDTLGFKEEVHPQANVEEPREVSVDDLSRALPTADAADINRAIEIGLLERTGDGFLTRSPMLLDATAELVADGVPISKVLDSAGDLRASMEGLAHRFVAMFVNHFFIRAGNSQLSGEALTNISATMQRYLVLAGDAVEAEFARAMQKAIASAPTVPLDVEPAAPDHS